MNKVYDAFGNELNVGDVIIVAVPLHWNGKGIDIIFVKKLISLTLIIFAHR